MEIQGIGLNTSPATTLGRRRHAAAEDSSAGDSARRRTLAAADAAEAARRRANAADEDSAGDFAARRRSNAAEVDEQNRRRLNDADQGPDYRALLDRVNNAQDDIERPRGELSPEELRKLNQLDKIEQRIKDAAQDDDVAIARRRNDDAVSNEPNYRQMLNRIANAKADLLENRGNLSDADLRQLNKLNQLEERIQNAAQGNGDDAGRIARARLDLFG